MEVVFRWKNSLLYISVSTSQIYSCSRIVPHCVVVSRVHAKILQVVLHSRIALLCGISLPNHLRMTSIKTPQRSTMGVSTQVECPQPTLAPPQV